MSKPKTPRQPADPLEAAKVPAATSPVTAASPLESAAQAAAEGLAGAGLESPAPAQAPQQPKVEEPKLPPAPKPKLAESEPGHWEVQRKITMSWGGQMITLHEGTTVSDAEYGPGSMQRMRDAGAALKPVPAR